jgi:hypothetical protein
MHFQDDIHPILEKAVAGKVEVIVALVKNLQQQDFIISLEEVYTYFRKK